MPSNGGNQNAPRVYVDDVNLQNGLNHLLSVMCVSDVNELVGKKVFIISRIDHLYGIINPDNLNVFSPLSFLLQDDTQKFLIDSDPKLANIEKMETYEKLDLIILMGIFNEYELNEVEMPLEKAFKSIYEKIILQDKLEKELTVTDLNLKLNENKNVGKI